jgi:predicted Zn-dependent protease
MLAYHDPDPKAFLDFLAQNRSDVSAHIHPAVIVQSEVIKRLDVDDILGARTVLNDNRGALGEEIAGSLQARMDASESDNPLPLLEARYAETGAIDDLRYLVGISWSRKEYQRASKYARTWFEAAPTVRAAELLVNSLSKCGRGQEVLAFLEAHPHLVDLSAELLEARAWHRFYAGQMSSAEEDLARLKVSRDDFNDISLAVSISVETGDWARAMALVEEEYQKRSKVPLIRLHQAATLAVSIGSERASELIKSLADHDEATADTKAQAYFLATRMGLDQKAGEWKVLLASWLETAIAASKEGVGPLQEATFEDMIEFAKKDRERRSYLFERLSKGEAPLSIVAQALNASILHFFYYRSYR